MLRPRNCREHRSGLLLTAHTLDGQDKQKLSELLKRKHNFFGYFTCTKNKRDYVETTVKANFLAMLCLHEQCFKLNRHEHNPGTKHLFCWEEKCLYRKIGQLRTKSTRPPTAKVWPFQPMYKS